VLYNLAKHQEIQQKVFEESRAVFGGDLMAPATIQKLKSLNYLELVIKESLRLYPSVPFFGRFVSDEIVLSCKIIIPKETHVVVSPYFLGRNPEAFPEPLKFDPSRFTEENKSFVPFSAGPRNCVGQKFAELEMKSIVSKVVRNFTLSIAKENEDLQLVSEFVLRPQNGIKLCAKQRAS
jgi:cytochrome P450